MGRSTVGSAVVGSQNVIERARDRRIHVKECAKQVAGSVSLAHAVSRAISDTCVLDPTTDHVPLLFVS